MAEILTNRAFYQAIAELIQKQRQSTRTLEEYLRALWGSARDFGAQEKLTPNTFFQLLADAFAAVVPPFDESWRARYEDENEDRRGFDGWESGLFRQVVDLREMDEQGILKNEDRYFGIDAPRGHRWYNFDPCTFLECATAGFFGGWEPGDETGRTFLPGAAAVIMADGTLGGCDPADLPRDHVPMHALSWNDFRDFLDTGQCYE